MTEDKGVALVTGGAKGIGKAISWELARRGWNVQIAGRDEAAIESAAKEIVQAWPESSVAGRILDIVDSLSVQQVFADLTADYGAMSLLVNCAGVITRGPAEDLHEAEWSRVIDTDLSGVFRCCQAAFPLLTACGSAAIVNIGSVGGHVGLAGRVAYTAAKAGLEGLTRTLALEWASHGIRVNTIAPGWTRTEMVAGGIATGDIDEAGLTVRIPQGRLAEPEEIAKAVVFLGSSQASYVTGQSLIVDGGITINGTP